MKSLLAALAICLVAPNSFADDEHKHSDHGTMDHSQMMKNMSGPTADAHFLDMMTQHHKDGIEMSQMAVDKSQNAELKKMAEKMVKDQTKEVEQMQKWRTDQFASVPAMDHAMPKMDMSSMNDAKGAEFDKAFSKMMSQHHQDGIKMANAAAPKLTNKEVKKFAQNVVKNQTKEKQHLTKLHSKIGGTSSGSSKAE